MHDSIPVHGFERELTLAPKGFTQFGSLCEVFGQPLFPRCTFTGAALKQYAF